MFYLLLYRLLKKLVNISFNSLNLLLGGNLPPLVGVNVIVEENGRFLIIERPEGGWGWPGGFMRWREQPEQAALREAKEETGLSLHLKGVLSHYSMTSRDFFHMSTVTIVYPGEVIGGELRSSVEGKPCWRNEAQLRENSISNHILIDMLDDYLRFCAQSAGKAVEGATLNSD